jgi:dethiobiotin synthetase
MNHDFILCIGVYQVLVLTITLGCVSHEGRTWLYTLASININIKIWLYTAYEIESAISRTTMLPRFLLLPNILPY